MGSKYDFLDAPVMQDYSFSNISTLCEKCTLNIKSSGEKKNEKVATYSVRGVCVSVTKRQKQPEKKKHKEKNK